MRKKNGFRPVINDILEDRAVPSALEGPAPSRQELAGLNRLNNLEEAISGQMRATEAKLARITNRADHINLAKMFEMQMLMNRLSQLSEMSTSVVAASNSAILSMARGVKS